jgi:hypothetical protein
MLVASEAQYPRSSRITAVSFIETRGSAMIPSWRSLVALLLVSAASAQQQTRPATASGSIPGSFVDMTEHAGIHFLHQAPHTSHKYLIETMGSGVALFDADNDGRLTSFSPMAHPSATSLPREPSRKKLGRFNGIVSIIRSPMAHLRT